MAAREIRLQPKQEEFLASRADIVIGGGAAGGGKSYALTVEPLRHINREGFASVTFRRTYPEIMHQGGLWDEAMSVYPYVGGVPQVQRAEFVFPRARIGFGYLLDDRSLSKWKSAQVPLIMFDQLETFTERMFFYMLSRNRSGIGIEAYVRATANPEPNWLADFLSWWIADDGYADLSRAGKIRAFVRDANDQIIWADTKSELRELYPDREPKTVTFIPFTIYDNPILMEQNPGYLASLQALPYVDRERLLGDRERGGNWRVKPIAGSMFNRAWWILADEPGEVVSRVRYWDLAATKASAQSPDPDWTAGALLGIRPDGKKVVADMVRVRESAAGLERVLRQTAELDGVGTVIHIEQEGGAGAKAYLEYIQREVLPGYMVEVHRVEASKIERAKPFAAAVERGEVIVLNRAWTRDYLDELHNFPDGQHDDQVDASSGAFAALDRDFGRSGGIFL